MRHLFQSVVIHVFAIGLVFGSAPASAGPHEEGIAAGKAANPGVKGAINASDAATNVPGYSSAPPERALYTKPGLTTQANAKLAECQGNRGDPACDGVATATQSANTARPAIGPYDPSITAARDIARNPSLVLSNMSDYYAGCAVSTASTPAGLVQRMCDRYTGIGNFSCRRDLQVKIDTQMNCPEGTWFAQNRLPRGSSKQDFLYAQAQCARREDTKIRFQFYAHGRFGACIGWQQADLPSTPLTAPMELANLSPHWGSGDGSSSGHCWTPFKVLAMPGSGCNGDACNYTFHYGPPVYGCAAGLPGDQLLFDGAAGNGGMCYLLSAPTRLTDSPGDVGLDCAPGTDPVRRLSGELACATPYGPSQVVGVNPGWAVPLSFTRPRIVATQTDTWDDKCPTLADGGRCATVATGHCVEGPSTKRINGVDVSRSCWSYETTLQCTGASGSDECAPLVAAGCTHQASVCVQRNATDDCVKYQEAYQCPSVGETLTKTQSCGTSVFCLGAGCFDISYASDTDFARSISYLEAAREAGVYLNTDSLTVFNGEPDHCRERLLKNCCSKDASGKGMSNQSVFGAGSKVVFDTLTNSENREFVTAGLQALVASGGFSGTFTSYGVTLAVNGSALPAGSTVLYSSSTVAGEGFVLAFDPWSLAIAAVIYVVMSMMECDADEGKLALKRGASLCHEVGSYCSNKILGSCVTETHTHCCFNSVLARIINEQGRAQLGKTWGTAKAPVCTGFTIPELQSLDFSTMDFSEFYASIVPVVPAAGTVQGNNAARVPACYYGNGKC